MFWWIKVSFIQNFKLLPWLEDVENLLEGGGPAVALTSPLWIHIIYFGYWFGNYTSIIPTKFQTAILVIEEV